MRRRGHRLGLAAVLTALAVAAPCTLWYLSGKNAAERQAEAIRHRPIERGHAVATDLAGQLSGRLQALQESESNRPFFHYQAHYHDPSGSCQCAADFPSPLASGPGDPFIELHFQMDARDELLVPTLEGDAPEVVARPGFLRQSERREQLEQARAELWEAADAGLPGRGSVVWAGLTPEDASVERFRWHTLPLGGEPSLVALRRVGVGAGVLLQGFLLSFDPVGRWLGSADYLVDLRPDLPADTRTQVTAAVDLDEICWFVCVDVGEAAAEAEQRALVVLASFQRSFLVGASAAVLAGALVLLLLAQTERTARERSRFAASAAHELRTPLAGMQLYGEMMAEGLGDPTRTRDYAQRMAEEAERLGRVVSNVLGFSRLEQGQLSAAPREGDLGEAVRESVALVEPAIAAQGARVELRLEESPPVRFDRDALRQILQNLLDNAEKYGRSAEDRSIEVRVAPLEHAVELSVADRGPGIPAGLRRRLFRPFARGGHDDAPAGLGLGLVMVRALARAQGASVEAENRPGGGARFLLRFPLA